MVQTRRAASPSPYLLLLLPPLLWSGNFVIGRAMRDAFEPVPLTFWRWILAGAVLAPFALALTWRHRAVIARHPLLLIALGVTGVGWFHLSVYYGLQTSTAINAGLLMATGPMMIAALSWMAYGEAISLRYLAGLLLSLAGATVVIARGDAAALLALEINEGDIWLLGAAMLWAVYSVLLKRRPAELPPLALLFVTIVVGAVSLAPLFLWQSGLALGFEPGIETLATLLYVSLLASLLAYQFWNRGVREAGPSRAGLYMYLMPFFSAVLSVIALGEPVAPFHVVGGALIFGGIALAVMRRRPAQAPAAATASEAE